MDEYVTFDAEEGVALRTDDTLMFLQHIEMNWLWLIAACTAEIVVKAEYLRNVVFSISHHQIVETLGLHELLLKHLATILVYSLFIEFLSEVLTDRNIRQDGKSWAIMLCCSGELR